jgi:hypothetical protein
VNESDMQRMRENRLINMQIRLQMSYTLCNRSIDITRRAH